jgi:hypothetical protein
MLLARRQAECNQLRAIRKLLLPFTDMKHIKSMLVLFSQTKQVSFTKINTKGDHVTTLGKSTTGRL